MSTADQPKLIHKVVLTEFPRAARVPKYTNNFQVSAFAAFAIVSLVKTSQWLGSGLVCEMCKREENFGGHFNNPPHMGSRVI